MGQLSFEDILSKVKAHPSKKVKVAIADIDGVLRGKVIHLDKFLSILEGGFGFCSVVFGWDMADLSYDNSHFTGWHTGYPDTNAKIDLNTFRQVPWDNDLPFFLADFEDDNSNPTYVCPRQLLKKVKQEASKMGYSALFSQEYEWFNFEDKIEDLYQRDFLNPTPMTKGMFGYSLLRSAQKNDFFNELFDLLDRFNVRLEGLHTETGPGVYEAAIQYQDILESADRSVLFKSAVKEIGHRHGIIPTFMAKWNEDLPGCSGHIHQSLWDDQNKQNLFYDKNDPQKMSEIMKHYLAGLLHCLPQILPMYAPTINSYKRLVEGAWAPTTLTWGIDNRTTSIRVLPGSSKSTRIEFRVSGSDMNPYLAMSACLASGLYGIKNKLPLNTKATLGNGYQDFSNGVLSKSLQEATQKMQKSDIAAELFGENFVKHFCQTREWECRQFQKAITQWELKRYFEII